MKTKIRTFSSDEVLVQQRRSTIIREAMHVFTQKGYDRTSMEDIAKALGMTKGFLYHYIGSKDDILKMILNTTVEDQKLILERLNSSIESMDPVSALDRSIGGYLALIDQKQDGYVFVNHVMSNLTAEQRRYIFESEKRVVAFFEKTLIRGRDSGQFQVDDPFLIAHIILLAGSAWAHRRWILRKKYTLQNYTEEIKLQIFKTIGV